MTYIILKSSEDHRKKYTYVYTCTYIYHIESAENKFFLIWRQPEGKINIIYVHTYKQIK